MSQQESQKIINKVKNNYTIAYKLLIENWKPFVKTEIFTLVSIAIILLGVRILSLPLQFHLISIQQTINNNSKTIKIQLLAYFNLIIILYLLLLTFLTSQFGLANDIFTSGHMYAEFSSSFTYYRRHKFSYFFLTLIIYWSEFLADPLSNLPLVALFEKTNIFPIDLISINNYLKYVDITSILLRQLILNFVQIISIIVIVEILASITQTNSLKVAIKQNFDILKKNKLLISITWLIYFLIFILPETLISIIILIIMKYYFSNSSIVILGLLRLIVSMIFLFISMPFLSLLATRLYVSLHSDGP